MVSDNTLHIESENTAGGVREHVAGERVPDMIWSPAEGARGPRPPLLLGHGGSQHKQFPSSVARARAYRVLFNAIGSANKTLHANQGSHIGIPPFEGDSWSRFFERHLANERAR
jgi:hypothetical protein